MGQKRKASDPLSPFSSSSPTSLTSLSHSNFDPPQPFSSQSQSPYNHNLIQGWASPEPYPPSGILNSSHYSSSDNNNNAHHLNSRTRKRFRDNRPDEETIHQATLSKLYAAQHQQREQRPENQDHGMRSHPPSPTPSRFSSISSSINTMPQQKEKAQTSLHAFFCGGRQTRSAQSPGLQDQEYSHNRRPSMATIHSKARSTASASCSTAPSSPRPWR